jgi:hypothetical protein
MTPDEHPHTYRADQARAIIRNADRNRFVFWWEGVHVRGLSMADYELWNTSTVEDAQHIIFSTCRITSLGQLEDQWVPWEKPSAPQKRWDKLYFAYMLWLGVKP